MPLWVREQAAADLGYLRGYNEALVVAVARRAPTFDRAMIAAATGLTPQAVSKVLARLIGAGLVIEDSRRRQGVGKPTTVYRMDATSRYAIGAHVGRRTLRLVLVDLAGVVHESTVTPLAARLHPRRAARRPGRADGGARGRASGRLERLVGVGIGMVGPLDYRSASCGTRTG